MISKTLHKVAKEVQEVKDFCESHGLSLNPVQMMAALRLVAHIHQLRDAVTLRTEASASWSPAPAQREDDPTLWDKWQDLKNYTNKLVEVEGRLERYYAQIKQLKEAVTG